MSVLNHILLTDITLEFNVNAHNVYMISMYSPALTNTLKYITHLIHKHITINECGDERSS